MFLFHTRDIMVMEIKLIRKNIHNNIITKEWIFIEINVYM